MGIWCGWYPAWIELRKVLGEADRTQLDGQLQLEAGTLDGYVRGPVQTPEGYSWLMPPSKEVVDRIYRAVAQQPPSVVSEMEMVDSTTSKVAMRGISHISEVPRVQSQNPLPRSFCQRRARGPAGRRPRRPPAGESENPRVEWKDGEFHVFLPMPDGDAVRASWRPVATSVVRIREVGANSWSPGFETPLTHCQFIGLKPDTHYEVQVTYKNEAGEGPPAVVSLKTQPDGSLPYDGGSLPYDVH